MTARVPRGAAGGGRSSTERGSATVLGAAMVAVLVLCLGAVGALLSAVEAGHRARSAADLAALAAAGALLDPADDRAPCTVAGDLAGRNGGRLMSCDVHGDTVTVSVTVAPAVSALGAATARARAGPATTTRAPPQSSSAAASTASSTRTAPGLSSGSLPLPHFGD